MKKKVYIVFLGYLDGDCKPEGELTGDCFLSKEKAEKFVSEMNEKENLKPPFAYYVEESFILDDESEG